ncbi:plant UBX domain-containing protein 10-like protein [Cinnamomum micranthum f. kanehirae]|uniref:Plant UBX domain-containing protein 10-like protein n=1 Tax=Cinnamomum micranthum f. kanehirae TaxID=337451 RepID=A0A3S3MWE8_9MAGN|nr:plant UBX domain-containing protein 10-like protein [Cinnamomum micranthum f. kanehirae]
MVDSSISSENKITYFQAITGIEDLDLCRDILATHGWDLELAISSFTSQSDPISAVQTTSSSDAIHAREQPASSSSSAAAASAASPPDAAHPGLAWKLITLPFSVISGGFGLVSSAVGLGFWAAGGVLSLSLALLGLGPRAHGSASSPLIPLSTSAQEAVDFLSQFERDYPGAAASRPNFVAEGFMEALQRARREFKMLFVYLHSPDHLDTPGFCEGTLCSEAVAAFVNENFVAWGGSIRASEGFKMSNSLKASRFPFCAVVTQATNQRIALLQQIEGPRSPEQMLEILQRVVEESAPTLVAARLEAEERRNATRLREEQDAAYRAALEADQARERQQREEQERLEREAAEAERKRKEEEEALERAAHEAAEKEAAFARMRQEKAMLLGAEPEKGPDVTQVLVRFPTGERKERRFHSSAPIQSIYDYVDSLDFLKVERYNLLSNFPRVVYGPEKHSLSLKEAGLHPQASLFVEVDS